MWDFKRPYDKQLHVECNIFLYFLDTNTQKIVKIFLVTKRQLLKIT